MAPVHYGFVRILGVRAAAWRPFIHGFACILGVWAAAWRPYIRIAGRVQAAACRLSIHGFARILGVRAAACRPYIAINRTNPRIARHGRQHAAPTFALREKGGSMPLLHIMDLRVFWACGRLRPLYCSGWRARWLAPLKACGQCCIWLATCALRIDDTPPFDPKHRRVSLDPLTFSNPIAGSFSVHLLKHPERQANATTWLAEPGPPAAR